MTGGSSSERAPSPAILAEASGGLRDLSAMKLQVDATPWSRP